MSSDLVDTVDLVSAARPAEAPRAELPPAQPHQPQPWKWRQAVTQIVAVVACCLVVVVLQWRGLNWTASAATWLEGSARPGGLAEVGAVAVVWRKGVAIGLTLGQIVSIWQFAVATGLLVVALLTAWRLRGLAAAIVALALFLMWPTSRSLLATVGAETPLAAALLLVVLAGLLAWPRPLASALLVGSSLALLVLVHPVGLPLAIVATLALLVLPLRRGDDALPGLEPHEGLWPHAVAVPQLIGILLAAGLVAAAHGSGGLHVAWMRQMAEWRAPVVAPWLGGLANWPALGPIVVLAGQTPVPLLALTGAAAVGALRRPSDPKSLLVAIVLGAWLALAWLGIPTPGSVDGVALAAPGIVLLSAVMIVDLAREVWMRGTTGARAGGLALAFVTLVLFLADQRLAATDRRNLLAHLPGVMATSVGAQPAVLRPADLGLLYRKPTSTAILPGHLGGNALATALRHLHPPLQGINFGAAFSTDLVLVSTAPGALLEGMWTQIGKQEPCSADGKTCLVRIRVK